MPAFNEYNVPNGWLQNDPACHALWYYYLIARRVYEECILDPVVYEGDKDPEYNFQQMFTSTAFAYGVAPERMIKFWSNVDMQCSTMQLPKMPEGDQYRFNKTPEVRTQ